MPVRVVADVSGLLAAGSGLALSTYTGVLLGATAIPVWASHATVLPVHFGASGLASAVAALELLGHRHPALNRIGIGVALAETAMSARTETSDDPAGHAIRTGTPGALALAAAVLAGPVPLALRVLAGRSRGARRLAALSTLAGSLLTRLAWVRAGRSSAAGTQAP